MTCYLTGHDDRFAAAVAGGVVSDLVSMDGTSDDGHFLSALRARRHAVAAARAATPRCHRSPRSTRSARPTLVCTARTTSRCPVGQAQQWHTALRERGVPTQLVLYPDASHVFILLGPPSQRLDFNRRVVDWVEQYAVRGGRAARRRRRTGSAGSRRSPKRHHVPGAQLGILRCAPGRRRTSSSTAAYGVLNRRTGIPATTDSVFQIGSITKVWTATVVMQLVDEGLLELDTPVVRGAARAPARRPRRHQAA